MKISLQNDRTTCIRRLNRRPYIEPTSFIGWSESLTRWLLFNGREATKANRRNIAPALLRSVNGRTPVKICVYESAVETVEG